MKVGAGALPLIAGGSTSPFRNYLDEMAADFIPHLECITCVRRSVCLSKRCPCDCHGGFGFKNELPPSFFRMLVREYPSKGYTPGAALSMTFRFAGTHRETPSAAPMPPIAAGGVSPTPPSSEGGGVTHEQKPTDTF